MGMPSGIELFIIVAVVVLLFGGKKIPELAKGIGKGIKDFKNAVKDDEPATMATNDKKIEEEKATTANAESTTNNTQAQDTQANANASTTNTETKTQA